MTPQRESRAAKVREWAAVADEDLRLARHALEMRRRCPHRMVAYHAQQCAEKYLKAFLVWRGVDFPFTHNLARLRECCGEQAAWPAEITDVEELSIFAVNARYPGESLKVSRTDAIESVNIAARVRRVVRRALRDEGLKP